MWKYIFSLFILLPQVLLAQDESILEDLLDVDTLPKYRVRSLAVNYNVMRFSENLLNKARTSQELQVEMGIHKFFVVADYGTAKTARPYYDMSGNYWRAGIDANLSAAWEEGNVIALGLRYAKASFEDSALYPKDIRDANGEVIIPQTIALSNSNLSARWVELVFKIRGEIFKKLYTGYTMRYQFFKLIEPYPQELRPFDVPGYGKTKRPNSFQFDYYIGWRLDF